MKYSLKIVRPNPARSFCQVIHSRVEQRHSPEVAKLTRALPPKRPTQINEGLKPWFEPRASWTVKKMVQIQWFTNDQWEPMISKSSMFVYIRLSLLSHFCIAIGGPRCTRTGEICLTNGPFFGPLGALTKMAFCEQVHNGLKLWHGLAGAPTARWKFMSVCRDLFNSVRRDIRASVVFI